ncbi:MAG: alpha/beta hydrolase [Candidatus Hermodarchaeota archaeon]
MSKKEQKKYILNPDSIDLQENQKYKERDIEFFNLNKQIMEYYVNDLFQEGLELALESAKRFPEIPCHTYSWITAFYQGLGKKEETIKALEEGTAQGAWWSENAIKEGFQELKDHPKFPEILELQEKKAMEEKSGAKAKLSVRTPKSYSTKKLYPLLLVLHGRYDNNATSEPYWKNVLEEKEILLASLQSSQMITGCHFVWDNSDVALEDLWQAYMLLLERYRIDQSKVILAGVSQGTDVALMALYSGLIPATGFISVAPSYYNFSKRFDNAKSLQSKKKNIRGYAIAGEKDPRYNRTKELFEFLKEIGLTGQFYSIPELGHQIPDDFDQILIKAINFIIEEKNEG